jgi:hypothetical protein
MLVSNAFSIKTIVLDEVMTDEWEGNDLDPIKVLPQIVAGGTKENHEKHVSRLSLSQLRFEPRTYQIHILSTEKFCEQFRIFLNINQIKTESIELS